MKLRNKKTGEIAERSSIVTLRCKISSSSSSLVEAEEFGSIEQLNEEWEDYEPKEPLIKDGKVRKAVRAWAEANDIEDGITYLDNGEFRSYLNTTIDFAILVDEHRFDLLKKERRVYHYRTLRRGVLNMLLTGETLREQRECLGISQAEIAKKKKEQV